METGAPISYLALATGTPVYSADETRVGTVAHVLAAEDQDLFEGLVITELAGGHFPHHHGHRFVDAADVAGIYEQAVTLTLSARECADLHEPSANPAVMHDDPAAASVTESKLRRAWDFISGDY